MANTAATVGALKALVVDADAKRGASFSDVLKNCGYTAVVAEDPMSAQMLIESEHFDVVLSQDTLGSANGLDVLKAVKTSHPDTPFVIMSADPKSPAVAQAMQAGADESFTTPNDHAALYPKLAALQSAAVEKQAAKKTVQPVHLPELPHQAPVKNEPANVDMIMDVPVAVNAVLGNTTMRIADLLQLGPGSVVELDKRAGEPIDLFVNDKLVAVGEVVVVNETFGVRITEVIDPKQRIQALN